MPSKLNNCPDCDGFLPPSSAATTVCPHCDASCSTAGSAANVGSATGWATKLGLLASGGAVAVTLMACYGIARNYPVPPPREPNCQADDDIDQDGYCAPLDCDEMNAAINPGAADETSDGIDQNCDGSDGPAQPDGDMKMAE